MSKASNKVRELLEKPDSRYFFNDLWNAYWQVFSVDRPSNGIESLRAKKNVQALLRKIALKSSDGKYVGKSGTQLSIPTAKAQPKPLAPPPPFRKGDMIKCIMPDPAGFLKQWIVYRVDDFVPRNPGVPGVVYISKEEGDGWRRMNPDGWNADRFMRVDVSPLTPKPTKEQLDFAFNEFAQSTEDLMKAIGTYYDKRRKHEEMDARFRK